MPDDREYFFSSGVLLPFFMKLFKTNNIDTVKTCQSELGFELPITLLAFFLCVKLISVIIICYVCSVRLLRLVTPLCVCIVCSCLYFLIKSALLPACIFYHSWWIKNEYKWVEKVNRGCCPDWYCGNIQDKVGSPPHIQLRIHISFHLLPGDITGLTFFGGWVS